jgi:DNA mismatch repair protein MutL
MAAIRILSEILANKIAAGEVVERPASVVKELVENALDAGSSRILIDVRKGGRSLIQVADNGQGMSPDDGLLAVERFATSKIRNDDDLSAIGTLGFRGEALPSIAAVSKMALITRMSNAQSGVEITVHGGKILRVNEAGAPQGTLVRVSELFFNTPARRKFLKSINTEMGHIGDTVAGMALGHHSVHFKLTHNDKTVKQWPRASRPAERIAQVLGKSGSDTFIDLHHTNGQLTVRGGLAPARETRRTSRAIFLFVNGRRVRDRVIQHALFEGYAGRLMKGQFPVAVLFVEIPYDQVDVNVHPTKHEIRFLDSRRVHNTVRDAVAGALGENEGLMRQRYIPAEGTVPEKEGPEWQRVFTENQQDSKFFGLQFEDQTDPVTTLPHKPGITPSKDSHPLQESGYAAISNREPEAEVKSDPGHYQSSPIASQQTMWEKRKFSDLTVIGQFRGTYIICQDGDDLILIDQHAAHERIVYERLAHSDRGVESQRLLMPETVELGFGEADALSGLLPQFNAMGLEIEPFGGTTFVIKSVPTLLNDRDIGAMVRELAEKAAQTGLDGDLEKVLDACRMVMACHKAVRANQRLAPEQISHLLDALDHCENPSNCPHGRPTWIRWTLRELEKAFKRITH